MSKKKKNLFTDLASFTKMNSRRITDLDVKYRTGNLEENSR